MNQFEKPVSDRSKFMYRFQTELPKGVNEDNIKRDGSLKGSKSYVKGYREEDRSRGKKKAQAFFGDKSVFGAKTEKGVRFFADEQMYIKGLDQLKGYLVKLKIDKARQVHPHEQYPKITDDKKFDILIEPTKIALQENDARVKSLAENQKKQYVREFNKNYSTHIKDNEEIVANAGSKGIEIVNIKEATFNSELRRAVQAVNKIQAYMEDNGEALNRAKALPPVEPTRMERAKSVVAKMSPFRRR